MTTLVCIGTAQPIRSQARSAAARFGSPHPTAVSLASERAPFCYGRKGRKTIAPGTTVSATSCCLNSPALLAPSGPARTHTSMCSDMRALLPLGTAMLGVVQGRGKSSASFSVIHDLPCGNLRGRRPWMAENGAITAPLAVPQPRCRSREQGAHVRTHGCVSSRRRATDKRQGQSRQQDVVEITVTGAMVFGYFLPKQKVPRSPPRRAEPSKNASNSRTQKRPCSRRIHASAPSRNEGAARW